MVISSYFFTDLFMFVSVKFLHVVGIFVGRVKIVYWNVHHEKLRIQIFTWTIKDSFLHILFKRENGNEAKMASPLTGL